MYISGRMRAILALLCISPALSKADNPSVIIVGAGSAGIAAASKLIQNGISNVTLLEAEERIGGRVYTTNIGEYVIDLGGQWVHGEAGNVVYEMVWPLGLLSHDKGPMDSSAGENLRGASVPSAQPKASTSRATSLADAMQFFTSSGEEVLSKDAIADMTTYSTQLTDEWPDLEEANTASVGEYLDVKFIDFFRNHTDIPVNSKKSLMNLIHRAELASQGAESLYDVSAKGAKEYQEEGDTLINWKSRTYGTVLDILMKKIPNAEEELPILNQTLLGKTALKIEYGSGDLVSVTTADGTDYKADYVIYTPSLGVLKMNHKSLFEPNLPPNKINAIENIGFGHVGKIYLFYDNPWWSADDTSFYRCLLWTEDDEKEIGHDPEKRWMLSVYSVIRIEWKPKILCLWLSGPNIKEMELLPEDLVKNQSLWLLNKFLGKMYNLTEPTEVKRTSWNSNVNFLGTYSYPSISAEEVNATVHDLAQPITDGDNGRPAVMFAGEATADRYGTVNGAIQSGWREAERIIDYEKLLKAAKEEE